MVWNAMYDELLKLRIPRVVQTVGFTDDAVPMVMVAE